MSEKEYPEAEKRLRELGFRKNEVDAYREETLSKIDKSQLTEDFPKEFAEFEDLVDERKDLHPEEAYEVEDQIQSGNPEDSEELDTPDTRFNKKHEVITDKDSTLKDSLRQKTDKPSDE